jgi:hypothetical protein
MKLFEFQIADLLSNWGEMCAVKSDFKIYIQLLFLLECWIRTTSVSENVTVLGEKRNKDPLNSEKEIS